MFFGLTNSFCLCWYGFVVRLIRGYIPVHSKRDKIKNLEWRPIPSAMPPLYWGPFVLNIHIPPCCRCLRSTYCVPQWLKPPVPWPYPNYYTQRQKPVNSGRLHTWAQRKSKMIFFFSCTKIKIKVLMIWFISSSGRLTTSE